MLSLAISVRVSSTWLVVPVEEAAIGCCACSAHPIIMVVRVILKRLPHISLHNFEKKGQYARTNAVTQHSPSTTTHSFSPIGGACPYGMLLADWGASVLLPVVPLACIDPTPQEKFNGPT